MISYRQADLLNYVGDPKSVEAFVAQLSQIIDIKNIKTERSSNETLPSNYKFVRFDYNGVHYYIEIPFSSTNQYDETFWMTEDHGGGYHDQMNQVKTIYDAKKILEEEIFHKYNVYVELAGVNDKPEEVRISTSIDAGGDDDYGQMTFWEARYQDLLKSEIGKIVESLGYRLAHDVWFEKPVSETTKQEVDSILEKISMLPNVVSFKKIREGNPSTNFGYSQTTVYQAEIKIK